MKWPYSYVIYGLRLASNQSIPRLDPIESTPNTPQDISVNFDADDTQFTQDVAEETPWYVSDICDENGIPALKIWKRNNSGGYRIHYSHGLTFYLNASLTDISIRYAAPMERPMEQNDVADFLLGPVLGVVLRLRGVICLHASAVAFKGKAIAFVGAPGAGKSTTAALFARKGHSILSDDIASLVERGPSFCVLPAFPYLNLWPETVSMLTGEDKPVSESPAVDKLRVPLESSGSRLECEALPLAAIYILSNRSGDSHAPFIEALPPQDALMSLVANTYGNTILDTTMRAQEFRVLGQIAESLPIRNLFARSGTAQLGRLYDLVCEDLARYLK